MAKAKKPKDDIATTDAKSDARDDVTEDLSAETPSESRIDPDQEEPKSPEAAEDAPTIEAGAPEQADPASPDETGSDTAVDAEQVAEPAETPDETQDDPQDAAAVEASDPVSPDKDNPDKGDDTPQVQHPLPVPAAEPRRNSFWPAVFGGVVAALLGFIAGRGDMLDAYFPRAAAPEPVDLSPLMQETAALATRIEQLENASPGSPVNADAISSSLEDLTGSLDAMQSALAAQAARLDEIEAAPAPAAPAPQSDNSEEIAALQSAISDLESRLAEEDARASAEAARLLAQAALTRVVTAVENGETFAPALGALEEVAPVQIPEALRDAAADGVPSMATLRDTFPEAARSALSAARADVPTSDVAGLGGFLRRQLGARSITPREGSDPDAVLSRAEAAVRAGDLDTALTELDALPDAATSAMQGWLDGARARKAASDAARALSDSLTVN